MPAQPPIFQRVPGASSAVVDGDTVVLSPTDMRYHALNDTASAIWDELAQPRTLDQIVSSLSERYDIDPDTCRDDVDACLASLADVGVVSSQPAPPG
jgi:hypothetical protein